MLFVAIFRKAVKLFLGEPSYTWSVKYEITMESKQSMQEEVQAQHGEKIYNNIMIGGYKVCKQPNVYFGFIERIVQCCIGPFLGCHVGTAMYLGPCHLAVT